MLPPAYPVALRSVEDDGSVVENIASGGSLPDVD
jgi:hypothetical protein